MLTETQELSILEMLRRSNMQKFVIKSPELNGYFARIDQIGDSVDTAITDEKYEAKIFDYAIEAKEWLKKIASENMQYKKTFPKDIVINWEIVLVNMKNGVNDFDEVMTWYSTTEM